MDESFRCTDFLAQMLIQSRPVQPLPTVTGIPVTLSCQKIILCLSSHYCECNKYSTVSMNYNNLKGPNMPIATSPFPSFELTIQINNYLYFLAGPLSSSSV